MPKEPYNLFSDAGSTLPGGSAYEDLLVILKGAIVDSGGQLEIPEELLMYVDRDESIRVHDAFIDGKNRKIFSIERKQPNQNPEGHIPNDNPNEVVEKSVGCTVQGIALFFWLVVVFAVVYLIGQLVRAAFF